MKDNRKRDERSAGTEEPWDTQRISLLLKEMKEERK